MTLVINVNGEVTRVVVAEGVRSVHNNRKYIAFDETSDAIVTHYYNEILTIERHLFYLLTPYEYAITLERCNRSVVYDPEYNLISSRNWLLFDDDTEFHLENVVIIIDKFDSFMLIKIPDDSPVAIERDNSVEEVVFDESIVVKTINIPQAD